MTVDVLGPAIAALRDQRDTVTRTVAELDAQLDFSRRRLADIEAALESLLRLAPESAGATEVNDEASIAGVTSVLVPRTGRIRTPRLVAEIVSELGRTATRDEVVDEAVRRVGSRAAEWSDPRNVVTVALNRAADQGLINKLNSNEYSPIAAFPNEGDAEGD
ncbi:MAG: hypothetical protein IT193_15920 [Propionibacteriaceae bacterium]|nr:hypothetical protein [Propionibacteriaceae bacterium]